MKPKLYLLSLFLVILVASSCKKWMPENRIVGTWHLVDAEKRRLFDRDKFATGYENGAFTFYDNGNAMYTDGVTRLDGNWEMRRHDDGYYDDDGNWNSTGRTVFITRLHNFAANASLDWYFDHIDFRKGGDKLFAFMDGASYTYRYDFRKQ